MLVKIKIVLLGLMFFSLYPCFAQLSPKPSTVLEINESSSRFGSSFARADFNGDGYDDMVIGAPSWTNGQTTVGAVVIFLGHMHMFYNGAIVIESIEDRSNFGYAVAAGATYYNDGNTTNEGGVLVYHGVAPMTNIPDINFERELIAIGLDRVIDGRVITGNIFDVESLELHSKGITSLTVIQDFKGLKSLDL